MKTQINVTNTENSFRFQLGITYATPRVLNRIDLDAINFAVTRHSLADWGEVCMHNKRANDLALEDGGRLFSTYRDANSQKFWVITEADRSCTTVLFPEEY